MPRHCPTIRTEIRSPFRPAHSSARLRLRLHGIHRSSWNRERESWLWRRRRGRRVPFRLRRLLLVHPLFRHRPSAMGARLAQTAGTMVMRMADADVLPFQFSDLRPTPFTLYVTRVEDPGDRDARRSQRARSRRLKRASTRRSTIRRNKWCLRRSNLIPPYLNFAPLDQASDDLTNAATEFDAGLCGNAGGVMRLPESECSISSSTERTADERPTACPTGPGSRTSSMLPASTRATA
jgi:hypothetical protein